MKRIFFAALMIAVMMYLVGCALPGQRCSMAGCERPSLAGSRHCTDHQGAYTALEVHQEEICRISSPAADQLVYNEENH